MLKYNPPLVVIKTILISILLLCSQLSVTALEKDSLLTQSIGQSVLNRYHQLLIKFYDYHSEKLGYREAKASFRIQNFPVLTENNIEGLASQKFHNELFFSELRSLKKSIKNQVIAKPRLTVSKIKSKTIRISNVPVDNGYLSSRFGLRKDPIHGSRRMHKGIDIAAKYGSKVSPLGEGKVVFAGYKAGYGNMVEIQHGHTVLTRYAHLKQFLVDKGQQVNVDDHIGLIGTSGRSTGPHLHLEVLFNDKQVDPQIFLANHFGSGARSYQIARVKPKAKIINKSIATKVTSKIAKEVVVNKVIVKKISKDEYPQVSDFPQLSYSDYVNSVDGLFGFSAPATFTR